ncbi:cytochrome P450 [Mariannaea sp. PMI_226]|nr:cytochrome P450 [Mariannaea sp. PMI_226]
MSSYLFLICIGAIGIAIYRQYLRLKPPAAQEVLKKNSSKSANRPNMDFILNLCGSRHMLVNIQYDDNFRYCHKTIHQHIGTKNTLKQYDGIQQEEGADFLIQLLNQSLPIRDILRRKAGSTSLRMNYGYKIERHGRDPLVELVEHATAKFTRALIPMSYLYLPSWVPDIRFKDEAHRCRTLLQAVPSFVSGLLEECNEGNKDYSTVIKYEDELNIKWLAAISYIDQAIGFKRLPTPEDKSLLPYTESIAKETLRWLPSVPMGIPHMASETLSYNRVNIPRGAILLASIHQFLHDPEVYTSPDIFDPERFLTPRKEPDPHAIAFGYGRRKCPGRYVAEKNLFVTITHMLSTFNILKAVEKNGTEIEPHIEVTPGVHAELLDFPCKVVPRNADKVALLRKLEEEMLVEEGDAKFLDGIEMLLGKNLQN